jgi:hypothetical protein
VVIERMSEQKVRKIRVDLETYEELERYAEAKGLTVEDYVHKLLMSNDLSEIEID